MKRLKNIIKIAFKFFSRPADVLQFLRDMRRWQGSATGPWRATWSDIKPMLKDRHEAAGSAKGHYFLQDIWAAKKVHELNPKLHVDVGSRVDGFVASVTSFCDEVQYVDIRKLETGVPNLKGIQGTACELPYADRSLESLSCLHVVEHIGLGRYGDPVDANAWLQGLKELQRVLAPGGQLLFATPCGRERVVFHAHRVFDPKTILEAMNELELTSFAFIEDGNSTSWIESDEVKDMSGYSYGCGLFQFTRP